MTVHRLCLLHADESENTRLRLHLLTEAAEPRGLEVVTLNSSTLTYLNLPKLTSADALYNVGRGSKLLETSLIRPEVATLYKSNIRINENDCDTTPYSVLMEKEGLPAPRTIYRLNPFDEQLDSHLEFLGGFPVVIKTTSGTAGVGTLLAESKRGFLPQAEFLWKSGIEFIVRQYIEPAAIFRVVVLEGRVVITHKKTMRKNDFRSGRDHRVVDADAQLTDLALQIYERMNFEFCGIDILRGTDGRDYFLESNSPHDFTPFVGTDNLAPQVVDLLCRKIKW